jgi:hypothetical protein
MRPPAALGPGRTSRLRSEDVPVSASEPSSMPSQRRTALWRDFTVRLADRIAPFLPAAPPSGRDSAVAPADQSRDVQGLAARAPARARRRDRSARPGSRRRVCATTRERECLGRGAPPRSVPRAWASVGSCRSSRSTATARRCQGRPLPLLGQVPRDPGLERVHLQALRPTGIGPGRCGSRWTRTPVHIVDSPCTAPGSPVACSGWLAVTPSTWAMNRRMRRWCPPFQYTEPHVSHCPNVA